MAQGQALFMSRPDFPDQFLEAVYLHCGFEGGIPIIETNFSEQIKEATERIRGPREVVSLWNQALHNGDIAKARGLTSKDTKDDFIEQKYGGWEKLVERYQSGAFYRYIYEETYGDKHDTARVVYHAVYEDPPSYTIRRFEDVIILEKGEWKIAPQWVVTTQLRPVKGWWNLWVR
ncbi:MAG: hypothetical protein ACREXM_14320 [Gammaproteobacteria bacterium]